MSRRTLLPYERPATRGNSVPVSWRGGGAAGGGVRDSYNEALAATASRNPLSGRVVAGSAPTTRPRPRGPTSTGANTAPLGPRRVLPGAQRQQTPLLSNPSSPRGGPRMGGPGLGALSRIGGRGLGAPRGASPGAGSPRASALGVGPPRASAPVRGSPRVGGPGLGYSTIRPELGAPRRGTPVHAAPRGVPARGTGRPQNPLARDFAYRPPLARQQMTVPSDFSMGGEGISLDKPAVFAPSPPKIRPLSEVEREVEMYRETEKPMLGQIQLSNEMEWPRESERPRETERLMPREVQMSDEMEWPGEPERAREVGRPMPREDPRIRAPVEPENPRVVDNRFELESPRRFERHRETERSRVMELERSPAPPRRFADDPEVVVRRRFSSEDSTDDKVEEVDDVVRSAILEPDEEFIRFSSPTPERQTSPPPPEVTQPKKRSNPSSSSKPLYKCDKCHFNSVLPPPVKNRSCNVCKMSFHQTFELCCHLIYEHGKTLAPLKRPMICDLCETNPFEHCSPVPFGEHRAAAHNVCKMHVVCGDNKCTVLIPHSELESVRLSNHVCESFTEDDADEDAIVAKRSRFDGVGGVPGSRSDRDRGQRANYSGVNNTIAFNRGPIRRAVAPRVDHSAEEYQGHQVGFAQHRSGQNSNPNRNINSVIDRFNSSQDLFRGDPREPLLSDIVTQRVNIQDLPLVNGSSNGPLLEAPLTQNYRNPFMQERTLGNGNMTGLNSTPWGAPRSGFSPALTQERELNRTRLGQPNRSFPPTFPNNTSNQGQPGSIHYKCIQCPFSSFSPPSEKRTCNVCKLSFHQTYELCAHLMVEHGKSFPPLKRPMTCDACPDKTNQYTSDSPLPFCEHRWLTHRFCKLHFICGKPDCSILLPTKQALDLHLEQRSCRTIRT